jgi:hypothetical protein
LSDEAAVDKLEMTTCRVGEPEMTACRVGELETKA